MADRAATLEILERLIAFDTTSRNSNLALIAWVESYLHARGVESTRATSPDGTKANLYARIGPDAEGGVILSGHTDVVPVDGQPWSSDPWVLTRREDKLYGRGVADMKSFVALALAHVDEARAAPLQRPIWLAFSYDEEVGCVGARHLIAAMRGIPAPSAVIVGEPTSMRVLSGHKGIETFSVAVEGLEAHSSQVQQGVSAIMEALPLLQLIADMGCEAEVGSPEHAAFSPPQATMTIGVIEGGTAANILARRCEFVWDLRCPPGVDPEIYAARFHSEAMRIDAAIKARTNGEGGVTVVRRSSTPAMRIDRDSAAEGFVRALTGDNRLEAAAYAAEGGLFQAEGWPTVICGPGSITQAHQPDEWIALDQIDKGAAFMGDVIAQLSL